jgi:hypothetical protein
MTNHCDSERTELMRPRHGPLREALFKKRRMPPHEEYESLRDQYLDYTHGDFWRAAVKLGRDLMRNGTEEDPCLVSVRGRKNHVKRARLRFYAEKGIFAGCEPWYEDRSVAGTLEHFVFPGIDVDDLADALSEKRTSMVLKERAERACSAAGIDLEELESALHTLREERPPLRGLKGHVHDWNLTLHADGCHWYTNSYVCACGATRIETRERGSVAKLRSLMTPNACSRCAELANGAEPVTTDEIREAVTPKRSD